ncbi:MAG: hypothetical protein SF182_13405 [Deltaproteobacteria bacterium]|nr:hypothetical protein [Deltaproteobacteria bacterium]
MADHTHGPDCDHDHDHEPDHEHGIARIVRISSGSNGGACDCGERLPEDFADRVNHYLDHGGALLHVGSESDRDDQGRSWTHTVAVVGFSD